MLQWALKKMITDTGLSEDFAQWNFVELSSKKNDYWYTFFTIGDAGYSSGIVL